MSPDLMHCCETMAKLICRASKLKSDCYQYRNDIANRPYCNKCTELAIEDVEHLIMHCPYFKCTRDSMFAEIRNLEKHYLATILAPNENFLYVLLGRIPTVIPPEMVYDFYRVVATNVHYMYNSVVKNRDGIG